MGIGAVRVGLNLKIGQFFRLTVAIGKMAGAHRIGNDPAPFRPEDKLGLASTREARPNE